MGIIERRQKHKDEFEAEISEAALGLFAEEGYANFPCASYDDPSLAGSGASTASQTAWALLPLMAAGDARHASVKAGVRYLMTSYRNG